MSTFYLCQRKGPWGEYKCFGSKSFRKADRAQIDATVDSMIMTIPSWVPEFLTEKYLQICLRHRIVRSVSIKNLDEKNSF